MIAAPILDHMAALADPIRCRMLLPLERHELTVNEICSVLQLPQSTVSRHLKTLADDGWVSSRRDGTGLGLKIDQTDVGRAGFVRCLPNGCVAEVVMDDKLVGQLKSGQQATFIIFQTPEEGIGIPLSLSGFGPGFDKLP